MNEEILASSLPRVHAEITELPKCIACGAWVVVNPSTPFFDKYYPELNKLIGTRFFKIIEANLLTDQKVKMGLEHHTSYQPETKHPVCLDCHFDIHKSGARRPPFSKGGGIAPPFHKVFNLFLAKNMLVGSVERAILLQTDATKRKAEILDEFSDRAVSLANLLLQHRKSRRLMDLHREMYSTCKENTPFNSQVICDIERNIVRSKGRTIKAITVKFNVPRNCKTFSTKSRFFVELGLYPRQRIAIPIRANRNFQRYTDLIKSGWVCKTYGLTSDGQIVAFLFKKPNAPQSRHNVVGVDVNSKCFAVSVLSPDGRVLKQLYYGKDIWVKRKRMMARRAKLQSLIDKGSHRARRSLKRLGVKEHNFVKNKVGEVVRDITNLATKYDADIAIENLKRFTPKGKRFNREVLRIPFFTFRKNLESRCFDKNIKLTVVDAYHTSKWCSHCGAVAKSGHSTNYALYKCKCGLTVNSDRKASFAIAVKSLLVRNEHTPDQSMFFQTTSGPVPVNGLLRSDADGSSCAVHELDRPMESHLFQ